MATVKISELPDGVASPNAVLVMNNVTGTETQKVLAGAIAALSGPVHSVAGRTGAVTIEATDVDGLTTVVQNIAVTVCGTASPVLRVAGRSGTVALTVGDISGFTDTAVSIAKTAAPILSINGETGALTISVNGYTGAVSLNATSVGAAALTHTHNATAVTDFVTAVATGDRWATVTIDNNHITTVADIYRLTAATATELRGITAAVREGAKRATLINVCGNTITIAHEHNADDTGFLCVGLTDKALSTNGWAYAAFDPTSNRWRVS